MLMAARATRVAFDAVVVAVAVAVAAAEAETEARCAQKTPKQPPPCRGRALPTSPSPSLHHYTPYPLKMEKFVFTFFPQLRTHWLSLSLTHSLSLSFYCGNMREQRLGRSRWCRSRGRGSRGTHTRRHYLMYAYVSLCVCVAAPFSPPRSLPCCGLALLLPLTTAASFHGSHLPLGPLLPLRRVYHTSFAIFHFNFH